MKHSLNCFTTNANITPEIFDQFDSDQIKLTPFQSAIDRELIIITSLQDQLSQHEEILLELMHRKKLHVQLAH